MNGIIEIKGLKKSFGDVEAVKGIDFCVKEGELFAFLGENGAGKSTTINIICAQLKKDEGSVVINGMDIEKHAETVKRDIGAVFQDSVLDTALSVYDNLQCRAALYGITGDAFEKRFKELSELFDLEKLKKRPVGKLSGGQKRRIDISRALLHRPKILILDEPTTGLDPQTRKMIWSVINKLRREENMTVFLTTHYMEEAGEADYVVILNEGKISAKGTPIELKNRFSGDFITLYDAEEEQIKLLDLPYEKIGSSFRLSVPNTAAATALIVKYPTLFGDFEITKGKMDDVFLAVTGKKISGGEEK